MVSSHFAGRCTLQRQPRTITLPAGINGKAFVADIMNLQTAQAQTQEADLPLETCAPAAEDAQAAILSPSAPAPRPANGESVSHHGEIMQGVFAARDGTAQHALVTLPCRLFRTRARFRPAPSEPITVEPSGRLRALTAARLTLGAIARPGWGGKLKLTSDVPLCWGCGSSTADVVATIRAVATSFAVVLAPDRIAQLSVAAEVASDPLMYEPTRALLFAQRQGDVMLDLGGTLPPLSVLGVNTGEHLRVETLALPLISYSSWELGAFQTMLGLLRRAVEQQDAFLLGRVATASTIINQRHRPKRFMSQILHLANKSGALGVQVAHSGTVAGLLFERGNDNRLECARAYLNRLGLRHWEFTTEPPTEMGFF
jgi:uncharacterized protein involved in propanediol utilization